MTPEQKPLAPQNSIQASNDPALDRAHLPPASEPINIKRIFQVLNVFGTSQEFADKAISRLAQEANKNPQVYATIRDAFRKDGDDQGLRASLGEVLAHTQYNDPELRQFCLRLITMVRQGKDYWNAKETREQAVKILTPYVAEQQIREDLTSALLSSVLQSQGKFSSNYEKLLISAITPHCADHDEVFHAFVFSTVALGSVTKMHGHSTQSMELDSAMFDGLKAWAEVPEARARRIPVLLSMLDDKPASDTSTMKSLAFRLLSPLLAENEEVRAKFIQLLGDQDYAQESWSALCSTCPEVTSQPEPLAKLIANKGSRAITKMHAIEKLAAHARTAPEHYNRLQALVDDPDSGAVEYAAFALGKSAFDNAEVHAYVFDKIRQADPSSVAPTHFLNGLFAGLKEHPECIGEVLPLINHHDRCFKGSIALGLANFSKIPAARHTVLSVLPALEEHTAMHAAGPLAPYFDKDFHLKTMTLAYLACGTDSAKYGALAILSAQAGESAFAQERLLKVAEDKTQSVRIRNKAITSLSAFASSSERVIDTLVRLLDDSNEAISRNTAAALSNYAKDHSEDLLNRLTR